MIKESVFCIAASESQSASILDRLRAVSFSDTDISVSSKSAPDIIGVLFGLGLPEYEARHYQGKVNDGGFLISVHTEDFDEATLAEEIFKGEDGHDIATTSRSLTTNFSKSVFSLSPF